MKKECNGNLKDIILEMFKNDTDCCEVTNKVGDIEVTVEVTITQITEKGKVVYDAYEDTDYEDEIEDENGYSPIDGILH